MSLLILQVLLLGSGKTDSFSILIFSLVNFILNSSLVMYPVIVFTSRLQDGLVYLLEKQLEGAERSKVRSNFKSFFDFLGLVLRYLFLQFFYPLADGFDFAFPYFGWSSSRIILNFSCTLVQYFAIIALVLVNEDQDYPKLEPKNLVESSKNTLKDYFGLKDMVFHMVNLVTLHNFASCTFIRTIKLKSRNQGTLDFNDLKRIEKSGVLFEFFFRFLYDDYSFCGHSTFLRIHGSLYFLACPLLILNQSSGFGWLDQSYRLINVICRMAYVKAILRDRVSIDLYDSFLSLDFVFELTAGLFSNLFVNLDILYCKLFCLMIQIMHAYSFLKVYFKPTKKELDFIKDTVKENSDTTEISNTTEDTTEISNTTEDTTEISKKIEDITQPKKTSKGKSLKRSRK